VLQRLAGWQLVASGPDFATFDVPQAQFKKKFKKKACIHIPSYSFAIFGALLHGFARGGEQA